MTDPSTAVARHSVFGPFDLLSEWAHELYLDGYSKRAVLAAREALALCVPAGDVRTVRYLRYTLGTALIELRHWDEAVEEALALLEVVDPDDTAWRVKTLSLLGDAYLRLGRAADAVDAIAEAYHLVEGLELTRYNEISAADSVAVVLGHAQLFEPADEVFRRCVHAAERMVGTSASANVLWVLVLQELAVMQASWGAALDLDGRLDQGRARYLVAHEVALRMMAAAASYDPEMLARGAVVEAMATARLGQRDLGWARLRDAMSRFELRPELPEVQMALVTEAGALIVERRFDEARDRLTQCLDGAVMTDRVVWELAALHVLSMVEVAEHGRHPALEPMSRARQVAARRLWAERENRFHAMKDRIDLRNLAAEATRLGQDALLDPLTGLGNRRMLDAGLASTLSGAALFVDVDLFKTVNDGFGHDVGDRVLVRIADILRAHCRTGDVVIRFGGDEFVVLLPQTAPAVAAVVAERVRLAVESERWDELADRLAVSVSVGVAGTPSASDSALKLADAALFAAKEAGRNRVEVY